VRVAADAADRVALHAQGLAGTAVAAGARHRIAAGLAAVQVTARGQPDPAGRVRAAGRRAGNAARGVAGDAAIRAVAGGAGARR